jgi:hypothetical protein
MEDKGLRWCHRVLDQRTKVLNLKIVKQLTIRYSCGSKREAERESSLLTFVGSYMSVYHGWDSCHGGLVGHHRLCSGANMVCGRSSVLGNASGGCLSCAAHGTG